MKSPLFGSEYEELIVALTLVLATSFLIMVIFARL